MGVPRNFANKARSYKIAIQQTFSKRNKVKFVHINQKAAKMRHFFALNLKFSLRGENPNDISLQSESHAHFC